MDDRKPGCDAFASADEMFLAAWVATLPDLKRRARRLAGGHHDRADDMIADTAIKALSFVRKSPEVVTDARGFLFVVLQHVFLDEARRRKREGEYVSAVVDASVEVERARSSDLSAPQYAELQDQMAQVVSTVATLSREQRRLFALRFVEDLPYPVIAGKLNIDQPLLRKRIQLLRRRLKQAADRRNAASTAFDRARLAQRNAS